MVSDDRRDAPDAVGAGGLGGTEDRELQALEGAPRLLAEGVTWIVELTFARPLPTASVLVEAIERMGFDEVVLDQREIAGPVDSDNPHASRARFCARLTRPIAAVDTEAVRWTLVHRVGLDVRAELRGEVEPFTLLPGKTYELRYSSRLRQSSRDASAMALEQIGFASPTVLFALKKNLRLPDTSGASWTVWYAVAAWTGPESFTSSADPVFFEDVREVEG